MKELTEFIQDDDRLRDERKKAKKNKDKYVGLSAEATGYRYSESCSVTVSRYSESCSVTVSRYSESCPPRVLLPNPYSPPTWLVTIDAINFFSHDYNFC